MNNFPPFLVTKPIGKKSLLFQRKQNFDVFLYQENSDTALYVWFF